MGTRAMEMVELAAQAAVNEDLELSRRVVEMDEEIDELEQSLMQRVLVTMLRESPVAHDFLFLTCTLGVIAEVEKVGDDATKLARRTQKLRIPIPEEYRPVLADMDRLARSNFLTAMHLLAQYNLEEADELIRSDEKVDRAYKNARNAMLAKIQEDPTQARDLFRCSEVFHALEHVSDRAVDIARRLKLVYERN